MHQKRILFLAPTRIGDAVLATALLAHIAAREKQARVTIVASPFSAALYENYPPLERLVIFRKQKRGRHWLTIMREALRHPWAEVWDMYGSLASFFMVVRKRRIFPGGSEYLPKIKQFEEKLGTGILPVPRLWASEAQRVAAEKLLPSGTKYLVFGPCANWPPKEWPMANFCALGTLLLNGECKGWRPVIVCAPHERERTAPLFEALKQFAPVDLTTGAQDLLTIYACMQRAQGFVGNDSGLMHMAAAAAIPTLGLFGPTDATVYQPWGVNARRILAPQGELAQLAPEQVAAAFMELIERVV